MATRHLRERLDRQAEYQREYRQRTARKRRPTRAQIAEALLRLAIDKMVVTAISEAPKPLLDELERMGFDRDESTDMIEGIVEREALKIA